MNKVKFNTHSLNAVNVDRLETYYKFYKIRPDENGLITPTFSVLKLMVSVAKQNRNAAKILEDNEELIAVILAERELTNSDRSFIAYADNPFINSIIALTSS